jgi:hypothetical protein
MKNTIRRVVLGESVEADIAGQLTSNMAGELRVTPDPVSEILGDPEDFEIRYTSNNSFTIIAGNEQYKVTVVVKKVK